DPQVAFMIFEEGVHLVKRHAFVIEFIEKPAFAEAIETAVGAHPKIAQLVLANGADKAVGQTMAGVISVEGPHVGGVIRVIPEQAVIRTNPDSTAFILANSPDGIIRQPDRHGEGIHAPASPQTIQPLLGGDPEVSLLIL